MRYKIIGKRNPLIEFYDLNDLSYPLYVVQLIGDPHLGKKFLNGVEKCDIGKRENLVFSTLNNLLNCTKRHIDMYVIMGDLFDKISITNEILSKSIDLFENSCKNNPNSLYYILNGNHDCSKDKDKISSFSLFNKYFQTRSLMPNLKILETSALITVKDKLLFYFSSYSPFEDFLDNFETKIQNELKNNSIQTSIAFGHYDIEDFGDSEDKLKLFFIKEGKRLFLNLYCGGHIHKPSFNTFKDTSDILISGSLQPYAFNEEIDEDNLLYVTIEVDKLKEELSKDLNLYQHSNVRILYKQDQNIDVTFKCLSKTFKLISENFTKKEVDISLSEVISFNSLILKNLSEVKELDPEFVETIYEAFLSKSYSKG